jgi:hypothetical protein
MTVAIAEFWKLAVESRLLAPADCRRLEAAFTHVKGAANQGNAGTLGEWLVTKGALSRYQVQTLLARRAGPFVFGDYCVYDRIRSKEGRLAGLYRAMHIATRHPVLLYFMSPEIAGNAEAWQAAAGQLAWACWVGHPYVCECHQLVDLGKFKVVAIENLPGQTAAARLAEGVRFPPQEACRLAFQAALGLARLHQLGLVHGEIQPDDLWLTPDGNLKLLQVPLAPEPLRGPRPLDWTSPTTKLLTATDYAAPELAYENRPPDPLTDIYALGATLFHLISGTAPFAGGDLGDKMARHAGEPVASLAAFGAPPQLDQVIAYMTAKDPSQRYQQAAQLAEALAYFVDPAAISAAPTCAPTLPAYDLWLQQQSRVPGMAAGAIPTGLQMAAYTAAQYAAAQQTGAPRAADQATSGQQSFAAEPGRYAAEHAPGDFDPTSNTPADDPLDFVPAESNRAQLDLSALGLSSGGRRAETEEMLERFSAPSTDHPAESGLASSAGGIASSHAAPAFDNLDAIMNASPAKSTRRKPVAMSRPASMKNNLIAVAVTAGALAVATIVGVIVAKNLSRSRETDPNLALGSRQDNELPPTGAKTTTTGQTSSSTTGTSPAASSNTGGKLETKPDPKNPPTGDYTKPPKTDGSDMVADDGKSFWASPTSGPPLNLNYLASGAQVVLAVRPASIVRRAEGDQILPALGPSGPAAEQLLKTLTGMPLGQIDQVIAVWHDSDNGQLAPMLIVRTHEKIAIDALLPAWGNPSPAKEGDESYYQGQPWSYYLPAKEEGKVLVVGQTAAIKEAIQSAGGTPAMSAHLERMLKSTDADRDVTLAFIPGSLFSDNQAFFVGELASLRKPAETFFGDDTKAGLVSLHFAGNFFVELRVLGSADKSADSLSSQFANRARSLPDMVENGLLPLTLHRYAKKLLQRFPEQLRVLAENTRSDVDDDMAVLRCYLPGVATHNLLLATELALAEQPLAGGSTSGSGAEKPRSIAELLKKKTTLTFPRDTLEKSLQMLMDDVGIKYEILGGDLQLEGITKNQSFGLDEKDKTAGEILRKIMT